MFADHAKIWICSGKGGNGHVSFRRELYVPNGGPDGGDGGNGGSIIFEVDPGLNTLHFFRHRRKFKAEDGKEGGKRRCHGKAGADLILKVPEGTVVTEAVSGRVIADLSGSCTRQVVLKGGKGGLGNMHFATAVMQAPRYAKPGQPAKQLEVALELKLLADVGLIGFPNAGKSTLLSRVSNARPQIAPYAFTTLTPQLGVVEMGEGEGFVLADIPGLIEGAADGLGLGHAFLRHIERTRMMIHVVDAAACEGRDPVEDVHLINKELCRYHAGLEARKQVIAANKTDLLDEAAAEKILERLRAAFSPKGIAVFPVSAATGRGLKELMAYVNSERKTILEPPVRFEQEFFPEEALLEEALPVEAYKETDGVFVVKGERVEKMLGYTHLESEKGFRFFQHFMEDNGIIDRLKAQGLQAGDTVRVCGFEFEYLP